VDPKRAAPYCWLSRIARDQLRDSLRASQFRSRAGEIIRQRRERRQASAIST
jgi:hypothetical protein